MKLTHGEDRSYDSAQRLWPTAMPKKIRKRPAARIRVRAFLFAERKKSAIVPFQPFDTARFNP
jgi:hypothetical protein